MKAVRRLVKRLTASVLGRRDDDRMREDLAEHLTLLTEEYARAGLPLDEARRLARIKLGGFVAATEACRDEQRLRDTCQDIHVGISRRLGCGLWTPCGAPPEQSRRFRR